MFPKDTQSELFFASLNTIGLGLFCLYIGLTPRNVARKSQPFHSVTETNKPICFKGFHQFGLSFISLPRFRGLKISALLNVCCLVGRSLRFAACFRRRSLLAVLGKTIGVASDCSGSSKERGIMI